MAPPLNDTANDNPTSHALAALTVLRPNGDPAQLGDQWAQHPIVLALLRHFG